MSEKRLNLEFEWPIYDTVFLFLGIESIEKIIKPLDMGIHFGYSRVGIWGRFACSRLEGQVLGLFMRQHFTVFKRISRLDAGAVSLTFSASIVACQISVSSAKAGCRRSVVLFEKS